MQNKTKFLLKSKKAKKINFINKKIINENVFCPVNLRERKKIKHKNLLLIFSGALMGFLNGFFGGGGGMICVPILQKVLSLDAKSSHATAIFVIFPLSFVSALIYVLNGYISSLPLLTVGLGVVLGGVLGAFALKFLPPKAVRIIFAVVMFAGGVKLII